MTSRVADPLDSPLDPPQNPPQGPVLEQDEADAIPVVVIEDDEQE